MQSLELIKKFGMVRSNYYLLNNEKNAPCDPLGTYKFPLAIPWGFTFFMKILKIMIFSEAV